MKLLIDMNLTPLWVRFLVEHGFEAFHWSSVGSAEAPDSEVMRWADENGCIVVTCDLDSPALLAATQRRRPSVILIRSDVPTPSTIGDMVMMAIRHAHAELEIGAVLSLDAARAPLADFALA